jgi:hypothetical protein
MMANGGTGISEGAEETVETGAGVAEAGSGEGLGVTVETEAGAVAEGPVPQAVRRRISTRSFFMLGIIARVDRFLVRRLVSVYTSGYRYPCWFKEAA